MTEVSWLNDLVRGLEGDLPNSKTNRSPLVPHAPRRNVPLSPAERKLAVRNALRYFPSSQHATLAAEFSQELEEFGHIYMYRLMPETVFGQPDQMRALPLQRYPAKCTAAAAIMMMVMNNLDPKVAQFPHELVTYGGNGQVFSNWAQFRLVMHYLSIMEDHQTLVVYSGHPLGLFPSKPHAPRMVITNGMVIPNYSSKDLYEKYFALGVTQYGQMTAGSYCYIGPQGIVHGTTITVMNAGRKYLGAEDLRGQVFVTSGLGGMSGAQAKAAVISGCIGVIAEICPTALRKRYDQGWLMDYTDSLDECILKIRNAKTERKVISIGYLGNVVDLWERLVVEYEKSGDMLAELGSDQTSCHNAFNGGYYPVGLSFDEAQKQMVNDPQTFKENVQASLRRQIAAIDKLSAGGMHFWDYGNAFLLECHRAGVPGLLDAADTAGTRFKYPSYVQDIMGDVFSMGFGPFRWVCTSCSPEDLAKTDRLASDVLTSLLSKAVSKPVRQQYEDNIRWIQEAKNHKLVVGSQARILYADQEGRVALAVAFNAAIRDGLLSGPVVLSRDHHDVSGTDSPFRETSNITDGSAFTADMAVQNCIGDSFRGATWVALHNGGGVGWGDVINGGFGLVLDGTREAEEKARDMLFWDVGNGVARRSWAGNQLAAEAIQRAMDRCPSLLVTIPHPVVDERLLDGVL